MNRRDFLKYLGLTSLVFIFPFSFLSNRKNIVYVSQYGVDWKWLKFLRTIVPYRTIDAAVEDNISTEKNPLYIRVRNATYNHHMTVNLKGYITLDMTECKFADGFTVNTAEII